jgi:hypothetical protein
MSLSAAGQLPGPSGNPWPSGLTALEPGGGGGGGSRQGRANLGRSERALGHSSESRNRKGGQNLPTHLFQSEIHRVARGSR